MVVGLPTGNHFLVRPAFDAEKSRHRCDRPLPEVPARGVGTGVGTNGGSGGEGGAQMGFAGVDGDSLKSRCKRQLLEVRKDIRISIQKGRHSLKVP